MNASGALDEKYTNNFIDYIVKKGYDTQDLLELSPKNESHRRTVQLLHIISQNYGKTFKNQDFFQYISKFSQIAHKQILPI